MKIVDLTKDEYKEVSDQKFRTLMSKNSEVETLYVDSEDLTDVSILAEKCPKLKIIHLSDSGVKDVGCLGKLPQLEELYLTSSKVQKIDGLSAAKNLRILSLSDTDLSFEQLKHITHITSLEELHLLEMPCLNPVRPAELSALLMPLSKLKELTVDDSQFGSVKKHLQERLSKSKAPLLLPLSITPEPKSTVSEVETKEKITEPKSPDSDTRNITDSKHSGFPHRRIELSGDGQLLERKSIPRSALTEEYSNLLSHYLSSLATVFHLQSHGQRFLHPQAELHQPLIPIVPEEAIAIAVMVLRENMQLRSRIDWLERENAQLRPVSSIVNPAHIPAATFSQSRRMSSTHKSKSEPSLHQFLNATKSS